MKFDSDGFYGTIFAVEGISDARVILNGPTGCRGSLAFFSEISFPRHTIMQKKYEEKYFFGEERVPCTYLDADDYIGGACDKLSGIIQKVAKTGDTFYAIVNSPGASLIGDDIERIIREANLSDRIVVFESACYSKTLATGFDKAITSILGWMNLNNLPKIKTRVNLIGLSIYHKHWRGTKDELVHICQLLGLEVVSVPGAGSTVGEIRESATASYNIMIYPEYSENTAQWYERYMSIPCVKTDGVPIGFTATEKWINDVAAATGVCPDTALLYIKEMRRIAFEALNRFYSERGFVKGMTFSIEADSSVVYPLVMWLYYYLNMYPVSIQVNPDSNHIFTEKLQDFLLSCDLEETLNVSSDDVEADLFFGDCLRGSSLVCGNVCSGNIDIGHEGVDYIDVLPKTHLGGRGGLYLIEQILNAAHRQKYIDIFK